MATEVVMPKLGLNMSEGLLVEWLKKEGDAVRQGEPLFVVETDKITIESEAVSDGILARILVAAGEVVPVSTPVGLIIAMGETLADGSGLAVPQAPAQTGRATHGTSLGQTLPTAAIQTGKALASPAAKRLAWDQGFDLGVIPGTGRFGSIKRLDVENYMSVKQAAPSRIMATPLAKRAAAELGINLATVAGTGSRGKISREDVERALVTQKAQAALMSSAGKSFPIAGVRAVIAERMHLSVQTAAQVTLHTDVDASALVAYREHLKAEQKNPADIVPSYNAILIALVARALREHPYINARQDGDSIVYLEQVNVGAAVDTERGLLVVVVVDADKKNDAVIESQLSDMIKRAVDGKSLPDDLSGGTFTITNLGLFGVDHFTPILNPPEVGILGVGRIAKVPAFHDGQIIGRYMMGLSLTFDHRLVDGAPAARFMQRISVLLQAPYIAAQASSQ